MHRRGTPRTGSKRKQESRIGVRTYRDFSVGQLQRQKQQSVRNATIITTTTIGGGIGTYIDQLRKLDGKGSHIYQGRRTTSSTDKQRRAKETGEGKKPRGIERKRRRKGEEERGRKKRQVGKM